MSYHHGQLRDALLEASARAVAAGGPHALSLRELARELGVSHAAARHHFGDKRGLLTALAALGYGLMAGHLRPNLEDFLEMGVGYVRFALEHPGLFAVMFQPALVDPDDQELLSSMAELRDVLIAGATGHARRTGRTLTDSETAPIPPLPMLAWSAAHGFATLTLSGSIRSITPKRIDDTLQLARETLSHLGPR